MSCDRFHPQFCGPGGVNIELGIGTPQLGVPLQPGFPIAQPGYNGAYGQQMDPVMMAAQRAANELRMGQPGAIQDIRQTVHNMPPLQAEVYCRDLQQLTGGRSPLREQPEMIRTPQGMMRTGNDVLLLTDPYRGISEPIKQIRHMPIAPVGGVPIQPYQQPGVSLGVGVRIR